MSYRPFNAKKGKAPWHWWKTCANSFWQSRRLSHARRVDGNHFQGEGTRVKATTRPLFRGRRTLHRRSSTMFQSYVLVAEKPAWIVPMIEKPFVRVPESLCDAYRHGEFMPVMIRLITFLHRWANWRTGVIHLCSAQRLHTAKALGFTDDKECQISQGQAL